MPFLPFLGADYVAIDRLVQQLKVHQQCCCVVFVALTISLTSSIASADLIGYWPFDTDFSDMSGNGYHGSAIANPLIDSDAILGAGSLSVNRPDGVEVMTSDEFYNETTGPLSATVWIKADRNPLFGGDYGIIIGKGEDSVFQFEYRTNGNVSWQIRTALVEIRGLPKGEGFLVMASGITSPVCMTRTVVRWRLITMVSLRNK